MAAARRKGGGGGGGGGGSAATVDLDDMFDGDSKEAGPHTWEGPMAKTWEDIEEDEKGELKSQLITEQRAKKHKLQSKELAAAAAAGGADGSGRIIEKGMIRYLYVILDLSAAMDVTDIRPTRKQAMLHLVEDFIREFFDQNPISQLGLIVAYKKIAEKITELSGNPLQQIKLLQSKQHELGGGEISLQNALEIARGSLNGIPVYGSREVVIITGSLGTVDPGDVFDTIHGLQKSRIRCSVIGLSAEVHVCTVLTRTTNGTYDVALSREHFKELLAKQITPLPIDATTKVQRKWIRMGFPQKRADEYPSLCACHLELTYSGYFCPKCVTKFCELPTDCTVCGLTLVSSPHLARSYHHLFAVPNFVENPALPDGWRGSCRSCMTTLIRGSTLVVWCTRCTAPFCVDCDIYIHEQLHNCPNCLSAPPTVRLSAVTATAPPTASAAKPIAAAASTAPPTAAAAAAKSTAA